MYQKHLDIKGQIENIFDDVKNCWIPLDPSNTDYQAVLTYCTENNITIDDLPLYEG